MRSSKALTSTLSCTTCLHCSVPLCTLLLLQIPGTYMDAMNSNTKLGKAVRAAVEELEYLGDLVRMMQHQPLHSNTRAAVDNGHVIGMQRRLRHS